MSESDLLWGAKEIRRYLADKYNYRAVRQQIWRLTKRPFNPLPVQQKVRGHRAHVVASKRKIDEWVMSGGLLVQVVEVVIFEQM